ncbi:MAG TPA: DUF3857 domain-containing protein [Terriglobales bacterium]|nr:DUF3857 domain-containing protein [Terriglobales bacterium]
MRKKAISFGLLLCLVSAAPARAFASVPDWLRALAQQPAKKYADDANAVVLLSDKETTIRDNGEIVTHGRVAFRILRPEGKEYAAYAISYSGETKINYLRGWSITAKGQEYEAKNKDSFEIDLSTYEIFSDDKNKAVVLPGADTGTVVGFEYEQKDRPYVFDDDWYFQNNIPVEKSRYTLRLPPNWEYRANWVNYKDAPPKQEAGALVWEVSDVPRIEQEYHEPPYRALAGHMIITFYSANAQGGTYKSWNDLGAWHARLIAGSFTSSLALQQKVAELAPVNKPLIERIKALANFAQQDIRYAAIEVGIGGFRPHLASEIFSHRYGDCKDKATLLSTMLAQIGVKSYYMPIQVQRGVYTERTPPNLDFNHVILAIRIADDTVAKSLPAIYEHPKLGHLLIFDPTNDLVPFGQLPYYEQDSYALLVTDNGGELIHLPLSSPEANKIQRTAKFKLLPDGTLQGEIEELRSGFMAMDFREYMKNESQHDRRKNLEYILGENLSNFQVDSFDLENVADIGKDVILKYKFTATHYAKNVGSMLLVRPRVVGEMMGEFDATKPRHYDYEFRAPFLRSDSVEISLPDGYTIDELPDPAKAVLPFAEYTSKAEKDGNVLKYSRQYKLETTSVPVVHIDQLRKLFAEINVDERNMAILKRVN